ncbi:NADH dehydrogenase [ubiquinone] 1 alpha subcomplex subunit 8-like [Macrosteles quadrilineatus]|uniref:NADH dehydrogenase [ubiquinone] 1 alpha subcomplex subunit 8-like n=1 Tax=Macrosteles quadrilineatus TaxID=74068 RepID=UPI0023E20D27|nr:NADH dehydrogenase [ubiquinone] 1 alpha subcomplex subunit 8-like [Macrosteles quadrilineatus]
MVVTKNTTIPSDEDLTVQEVDVSGVVLRAASFHLGKYCEDVNNEFMLCRGETKDIRKCLTEGKAVTNCSLEFFQKVKTSCFQEFTNYYNCIDKSSPNYQLEPCRKTQKVFDKCMVDNLNLERPHYGYFCEVKVHDSPRPKPEAEVRVYADTPDKIAIDSPKPPGKYGSRNMFF